MSTTTVSPDSAPTKSRANTSADGGALWLNVGRLVPVEKKIPRSYLFVPGDRAEVLKKAADRGADALVVDLEDAVAPSSKDTARAVVTDWLGRRSRPTPPTWIRINSDPSGERDIEILAGSSVDGVMIPKVRSADDVRDWCSRIEEIQPAFSLLVLVETAGAMRQIDAIASTPGVTQLMIGEADLGAELGIVPTHTVWDSLRADVVVGSAAAGISPPIGPVDPDFSSPERMEAGTRHLQEMGFASRAVIHPAQIAPVHAALTPSAEEVEAARRTLSQHEQALASGRGAYVDSEGVMVDEAMVRRARHILAIAREER